MNIRTSLICLSLFLVTIASSMQKKITSYDEDIKQRYLEYLLYCAAERGDAESLKQLLAKGAPIEHIYQPILGTPLMSAIVGDHQKCVQILIDARANINCVNCIYETPLMIASRKGFLSCVKMLIQNKAQINRQNSWNNTALIETACSQTVNLGCIRALIDAHAQIDITNGKNQSALSLAANKNASVTCDLLVNALLIPKPEKDKMIVLLGCRNKGLLEQWKIPKDIIILLGKYMLAAIRQTNKPKVIKELDKIKDTGIGKSLLGHYCNE